MRPMYEEKPLDEGKKNQLLATLNALDDTEKSPSGNSTNELYQPSFRYQYLKSGDFLAFSVRFLPLLAKPVLDAVDMATNQQLD